MILFHKTKDLTNYLCLEKEKNKTIGFVPTMGALHQGHISLITVAQKQAAIIVCSIFVNPTQFNDPNDFKKYPKTMEQDIYQLEKAGCTVVFLPDANEIYPNGIKNNHYFDLGYIETILDGEYRAGHFQGVCQVVHKLIELVLPDFLYLGEKDYQQCLVLKKMAADYFPTLKIVVCPTQREADGLAMSSRNMRLNKEERSKAPKLYETLQMIKNSIKPGNIAELKNNAVQYLTLQGFTIDYIEVADSFTLKLMNDWDGKETFIILIAAFLNEVRLIDNLLQTSEVL